MTHIPVLATTVLEMIDQPPQLMLDGTFGRGGHTRLFLQAFPQIKILGLDQDAQAISFGKENFSEEIRLGHLHLLQANFGDFESSRTIAEKWCGGKGFDVILLDLGVSSPQLDQAQRGFSFYSDGPLDMRMDQRTEVTAKTIVNDWEASALDEIFRQLGEVQRPKRVVDAIIAQRRRGEIASTLELASLIEKCEGWKRKGHHPATQYFLALRLEVNQELEVIKRAIPCLVKALADQGRLFVITFHSLEDRLVKHLLKNEAQMEKGFLVNKKVIQPSWEEVKKNPRARSAKLRIFQKGPAPLRKLKKEYKKIKVKLKEEKYE